MAALIEDDNNRQTERIEAKPDVNFTDYWTIALLQGMMLQRLSHTEVIIVGKVKTEDKLTNRIYEFEGCYRVPKYSEEAWYIPRFAAFCKESRTLNITFRI